MPAVMQILFQPEEEQVHKQKGKKLKLATTSQSKVTATEAPKRNYSEPTRVEKYLSSIDADRREPTLEDIERHRPAKEPNPKSQGYATEYNNVVDTLCRSFTKRQLQNFLRLYGMRSKRGGYRPTKLEFVHAIVEEQWGWPSLEKVQKDKRDRTEVSKTRIEVSPSELFMILGREEYADGADLLQLSSKHNVQVSVRQDPLALHVEGVRVLTQRFSEAVKALKKNIHEETFRLPTRAPIPSEMRQRISRLANAYIENVGDDGLVRICAKDAASLSRAKRFTTRVTGEILGIGRVPVVTHLTESSIESVSPSDEEAPKTYALYPFLSPRALPWVMDASGIFRVRRVVDWLLSPASVIAGEVGLAQGSGTVIAADGTVSQLKEVLLPERSQASSENLVVKARLGHMLFSTKSSEKLQALSGPLKGHHGYNKIQKWMSSYEKPTFVPNLPTSLVHSSPAKQKIIYRLVYRVLPSAPSSAASDKAQSSLSVETDDIMTLEIVLAQPKETVLSGEDDTVEKTMPIEDQDASVPLPMRALCVKATESLLDVMLPDKAMDIRFVVSRSAILSETEQPPALREYALRLHEYTSDSFHATRPDPPLTIVDGGKTYLLYNCYNVRQNEESADSEASTTLLSESILDLDSRQRSTLCEVITSEPTSDAAWTEFLRSCDTHVSALYQPAIGPTSSSGFEV
ncbi:hypothetical protein BDW22DRAFT_1424598 [Trametopsis cervina]|nr:hypothetical protein BDW22DRAFT_1424598 [Trametopsis cervina]